MPNYKKNDGQLEKRPSLITTCCLLLTTLLNFAYVAFLDERKSIQT